MPVRVWFPGVLALGRHLRWNVAVVVLILGTLATFGVSGWVRGQADRDAREALAAQGELLSHSAEHDVEIVVKQLRDFRGLFEASVHVTKQEFQVFAAIARFTPSTVLMFAALRENSDGTLSWPIEHVVANDVVGPAVGEDLYRDPVLAAAIDRAVVGKEPAVSGFIDLQDGRPPGEVGIFQVVFEAGRVVGVVGALVHLDEPMEQAAEIILNSGESWALEAAPNLSHRISTAYEWSSPLDLGLRQFQLTVRSNAILSPWSQRPLIILVAGLLITALAARVVLESQRRGGTDRELEWLRRSSADKDRFLAGVGHELRTPLTVVVGMLDLATDPGRSFTADDRAELMTTARVNAQELARIVDDFVTAGRLAADALTVRSQPTDLDPLVAKVIAAVPSDPRLAVTTGTDLGTCLGDGLRITQILLNLLRNALRNAKSLVEVIGHADDRFVTLEVCNDGPAIPTELGNDLFEPFMAARPEGQPQPVGLGLSVSRALARRMGGDLIYQWREGQVVFSLSLPRAPVPVLLVSSAARFEA